jgi:hypothetical protein
MLVSRCLSPARSGAKRTRAVTVVELLVVTVILTMLLGIVYSVLVLGKERGKVATDISNLHQLAVAGSIYAEDFDDMFPLSTRTLLNERRVEQRICVSPADPYPKGYVAAFIETDEVLSAQIPPPYPKTSYVGPLDAGWQYNSFQRRILSGRNPGWLINTVRADHRKSLKAPTGTYQRLLVDGSVQTRRMGFSSALIEGAFVNRVIAFGSYFCDEDAEWFEHH